MIHYEILSNYIPFFAEGHAYEEEAHGIVSGIKSEVSDARQISRCTKIRQHGKYVLFISLLPPSRAFLMFIF